ncbi:AAA family ATPase [Listeria costaricensis]|uniref:AAA family ATPase n=1 Tax=Listeria costaricensis TaxID=2026604 RepID=UPI000C07094A|nr:AAA family ATPase [Listeria costaricensis]
MGNLTKPKLKAKRVGVVFGCFAPCHLGHLDTIIRAKRENDGCIVIASGRTGDRGDKIGLDLNRRFRYLRELFADDEQVYVVSLNESHLPEYPHGWTEWLNIAQDKISAANLAEHPAVTWYVGEAAYKEELEQRTVDRVQLVDRTKRAISGTAIRNNPLKYWQQITKPFRRAFSINILVMGTASGGKTTLVRDLARTFGSHFTDEYARRYEEKYNVRDEELTVNDFQYLASGQFENNKQAILSDANNGLFFADTDVMVTKVYAKYYLPENAYSQIAPSFDLFIQSQKWDLIFVIPPITQYVNDGFRDMSYSDDKIRWQMHQMFIEEIEANHMSEKVIVLDQTGNETDKEGFYARYEAACEEINHYIANYEGEGVTC